MIHPGEMPTFRKELSKQKEKKRSQYGRIQKEYEAENQKMQC